MNIVMSGLDYVRAPISLRERLSFTKSRVGETDRLLRAQPGVLGCVLLSTCNRTELYLSCAEGADLDPAQALCACVGAEEANLTEIFTTRRGEEAVSHLMAVAGGLKSQIWGDDQIVTQVKAAAGLARAQRAADPVLETLFREAAAAGKELKTKVRLNKAPVSAASRAVELLCAQAGGLSGLRALVVGNGAMGRLAAELLRDAGCAVTVTLRTYRHGETLVPFGCGVVAYDDRYAALEGTDLVLSATVSPHYTFSANRLSESAMPRLWADLAIPRDIDPAIGALEGTTLFNMDDLGCGAPQSIPEAAQEILDRHRDRLYQWAAYRESLPALEKVKNAITRRVLLTDDYAGLEPEALIELAVGRTVDLLSGGLKEDITEERLERCAALIRTHTRAGGWM